MAHPETCTTCGAAMAADFVYCGECGTRREPGAGVAGAVAAPDDRPAPDAPWFKRVAKNAVVPILVVVVLAFVAQRSLVNGDDALGDWVSERVEAIQSQALILIGLSIAAWFYGQKLIDERAGWQPADRAAGDVPLASGLTGYQVARRRLDSAGLAAVPIVVIADDTPARGDEDGLLLPAGFAGACSILAANDCLILAERHIQEQAGTHDRLVNRVLLVAFCTWFGGAILGVLLSEPLLLGLAMAAGVGMFAFLAVVSTRRSRARFDRSPFSAVDAGLLTTEEAALIERVGQRRSRVSRALTAAASVAAMVFQGLTLVLMVWGPGS